MNPHAMRRGVTELSPELEKALNHHVTQELAASHSYLAAAAVLQETGLEGMAKWMRMQAEEERQHGMKFFDYIHERHGKVRLEQIPKPDPEPSGALGIFEQALRLEKATTLRIRDLHREARAADDVALEVFLQWFVQEQVQEENTLRTILDRFALGGKDHAALLLLDAELGRRSAGGA